MSNLLQNRKCYLGGPIEYATSGDWRTPVKNVLTKRFGLRVFDPFEDPKQAQFKDIKEFKEQGRYDELSDLCWKFVHLDLGVVDRSDFIIQHLPYKVPTTGTVHEIINSNNNKKPTILVCPDGGKQGIASWFFGFVPHQYMFGSWEDMYNYLGDVNLGLVNDDRWFFVNNYRNLNW